MHRLMLSELIENAQSTFEKYGDMPVNMDHIDDKYEWHALATRIEIDAKTKKYNFTVANYYHDAKFKLVK